MIPTETITEMPSQSHVVTLLAILSPGVVQQDQNNNVVRMWSYLGASQIEANGGRNNTWSNTFQLDGMANTKSGGNISFLPPMDSVQEFRVQTNAYDAAIGRQAGSTINMQTRSGGKDYHGTLYEFNQNNLLNANLFQTNRVGGAVPMVHFNEFGGTFGGPVWVPKVYDGKEKTFFFFSYEDTHNQDPRPGSTRSMPVALFVGCCLLLDAGVVGDHHDSGIGHDGPLWIRDAPAKGSPGFLGVSQVPAGSPKDSGQEENE